MLAVLQISVRNPGMSCLSPGSGHRAARNGAVWICRKSVPQPAALVLEPHRARRVVPEERVEKGPPQPQGTQEVSVHSSLLSKGRAVFS